MQKSLLAILGIGAAVIVLVVLSSNGMLPLQGDVAEDGEEAMQENTGEEIGEGEDNTGTEEVAGGFDETGTEEEAGVFDESIFGGAASSDDTDDYAADQNSSVCNEEIKTTTISSKSVPLSAKASTEVAAVEKAINNIKAEFKKPKSQKAMIEACKAARPRNFKCGSACSSGLLKATLQEDITPTTTVSEKAGVYTATATASVSCTLTLPCTAPTSTSSEE